MEKLDVTFKSTMSEHDNCVCDACHDSTTVMKVTMPRTKYFDGELLSTHYNEYWLCARCRSKLVHALDFPNENKEATDEQA